MLLQQVTRLRQFKQYYQRIALVIQDMNFTADTTSGEEGKELFYALRDINPHLPIILITAWTELSTAVELVKAGAADYLPKPWDDAKLLTCVNNLIELGKAKHQNETFTRHQQERDASVQHTLVGLYKKYRYGALLILRFKLLNRIFQC